MSDSRTLIHKAREAVQGAYAPYSHYNVGAALLFDDGTIVTGANIENASFGLTLCAETVAVANAMSEAFRGGLVEVAVFGPGPGGVTPCGRCRQMIYELAALGESDPVVWCCSPDETRETRLSALLPEPFGPANLD